MNVQLKASLRQLARLEAICAEMREGIRPTDNYWYRALGLAFERYRKIARLLFIKSGGNHAH